MLIRCECGETIDLENTTTIIWYLKGGPIKCPKCGKDIYFKKEEE